MQALLPHSFMAADRDDHIGTVDNALNGLQPRIAGTPNAELHPALAHLKPDSWLSVSSGLTLPHSLQLGHCQWWLRAPNPHRLQR